MKIDIITLTSELMEIIRTWRNDILETLRTPFRLTQEMQQEYYKDVICNRDSKTRYYGFIEKDYEVKDGKKINLFVGMGGIENIEWENRRGEVSMIINPEIRGKGYGREVFKTIKDLAFNHLNLDNIWGEVFDCAIVNFWKKMIAEFKGESAKLPCRKYYDGKYHGSLYFNFKK